MIMVLLTTSHKWYRPDFMDFIEIGPISDEPHSGMH